MSAQKRGSNYEHDLANEIYVITDGLLMPIRNGYSGNGKIAGPDVFIDDGSAMHAIELKRKTQGKDAISFGYEPDDRQKDDIHRLVQYCRDYPRPCYPYVGVRFANRQLVLSKLYLGDADNPEDLLQSGVLTCPVEAKVTRSNNLRIYKPDTDDWPSQSAGNDAQHVLDRIAYQF